jgi:hypothetical protein
MPENRSSLAAYARTRTRTTYFPSTPSRNPENCKFSGMSPTSSLGHLLHAMQRHKFPLVGMRMHKRARRLTKTRRLVAMAAVTPLQEMLVFSSGPYKGSFGHADHVEKYNLLARSWRVAPGSPDPLARSRRVTPGYPNPRTRRRVPQKAHGRPRHRQKSCRMRLHIALLRIHGLPVSMLPPEVHRNFCVGSRGSAPAPL